MPYTGELDKRVAIESVTESKDSDNGELVETWAVEQYRWASIKGISGNERMVGAQLHAEATHLVTFRWFSGLTAKKRITYMSEPGATERTFDIVSTDNWRERKMWLFAQVKERV